MNNILTGLFTNLLSNLIWVVTVGVVTWLVYVISIKLPLQRLWRLKDPSNLIICASNSVKTHTGEYHRPATGIGQVRASALIIRSLSKAYGKKVDIRNIMLSTDPLQDRWDRDIIIMGGPKTNEIANEFLKARGIHDKQPAWEVGTTIFWREKHPDPGIGYDDQKATSYLGKTLNDECVTDYGFVIRAKSPFKGSRTVVLFAGSHTYGTAAVADYFTGDMRKDLRWQLFFKRNVVALISLEVKDGFYHSIKLEKKFTW